MKYFWFCLGVIIVYGCSIAFGEPKTKACYYQSKTNLLREDGLYSTYDSSMLRCGEKANQRYKVINPIVLMKTNSIYYDNRGVSFNLPDFSKEYYQHQGIGNYKIIGDSIYATIPSTFAISGMRMRLFEANYVGYIKNKDTILGWKMIPPYPNVKPKWNDYFIKDTAPKILYFIKHENVKELEKITEK